MPTINNTLAPDERRQKKKDKEGDTETERQRESWCTSVMHYCRKCQCCYPGFRNYVGRVCVWGGGWWVLLKSQSDSSSSASLLLSDCIHTYMHKHTHKYLHTRSLKNQCFLFAFLWHAHTNAHTHTAHYPPMNSSGRSQPSSFLWTQTFP